MSSENSSNASGGIGFAGLLALLFIGLKLTHVIDWSWWWVLSPLWISAGIAVLIVLALLTAAVIGAVRKPARRKYY